MKACYTAATHTIPTVELFPVELTVRYRTLQIALVVRLGTHTSPERVLTTMDQWH